MNPRRESVIRGRQGAVSVEVGESGRQTEVSSEIRSARGGQIKRLLSVTQWILVPLILLVGLGSYMLLVGLKEEPVQLVPQEYTPLVSVIQTSIEDRTVDVSGNGVVTAQTRIDLVPQVGGQIISIHPSLRAGGRFVANEILLEIEPIDYELSVIQAESEVAAAARKLELERAEADAALQEWAVLHAEEAAPKLVARKPQILEAEANVKAAQARLRLAELNLSRTRLSMPFDGRVVSSSVDAGEVVPANMSVGIVYSNEVFEIPVPLEYDQLSWIRAASGKEPGSDASISIRIAGTLYDIDGEVVRIESELDAVSRLARAIVRLTPEQIPEKVRDKFIPGMFVDVRIVGEALTSVTSLPRSVIRDNQSVWTVQDGRLNISQPEIIYESASDVLVRGLPADSLIISSQLEVVTNGMKVRLRESAL